MQTPSQNPAVPPVHLRGPAPENIAIQSNSSNRVTAPPAYEEAGAITASLEGPSAGSFDMDAPVAQDAPDGSNNSSSRATGTGRSTPDTIYSDPPFFGDEAEQVLERLKREFGRMVQDLGVNVPTSVENPEEYIQIIANVCLATKGLSKTETADLEVESARLLSHSLHLLLDSGAAGPLVRDSVTSFKQIMTRAKHSQTFIDHAVRAFAQGQRQAPNEDAKRLMANAIIQTMAKLRPLSEAIDEDFRALHSHIVSSYEVLLPNAADHTADMDVIASDLTYIRLSLAGIVLRLQLARGEARAAKQRQESQGLVEQLERLQDIHNTLAIMYKQSQAQNDLNQRRIRQLQDVILRQKTHIRLLTEHMTSMQKRIKTLEKSDAEKDRRILAMEQSNDQRLRNIESALGMQLTPTTTSTVAGTPAPTTAGTPVSTAAGWATPTTAGPSASRTTTPTVAAGTARPIAASTAALTTTAEPLGMAAPTTAGTAPTGMTTFTVASTADRRRRG